jgi:hypothetical protein
MAGENALLTQNVMAALNNLGYLGVLPVTTQGAPTSGTSGSYATFAGIGTLLIDTTNGKLYINTGTKASPTWTVVGAQT